MTDQPLFELGLNPDMPNETYHRKTPGISKSMLDKMAECPLKFWNHYENPEREPEEKSDELRIGNAYHTAVLQPDLFAKEHPVMPPFNLKSSTARAERDAWVAAEAKGKDYLSVDEAEIVQAMATVIRRHPVASSLLRGLQTGAGRTEQSFFAVDPETGELIKCRTDYFDFEQSLVVDLKSTKEAGPEEFAKSVVNYRYLVQEPWYKDVIKHAVGEPPAYWAFLAQEKKPPYAVGIYTLDAEDVAVGRALARRDFRRILECRRTGIWPDYCDGGVKTLQLPGWYRAALGFTSDML